MDVELPDGSVIEGVPDGMSQRDLVSLLSKNGHDTSWYKEPKPGALDRIKSALTPSAEREPMPSTADTINAGWTAPDDGRVSLPGSVMDGFVPKDPNADKGVPIEAGMGPMRQDYYNTTRAGLLAAPVKAHAAATTAGGQVGKVAAATLPERVGRMEREARGDMVPRTRQDLEDATSESLSAQPLRTEAAKQANREWLNENSAAAIEGIKRYTNMDQADAEAELAQMVKYGVKPGWVDGSMPDATLMQAASANIAATGPSLQKALVGLSEAAADQPFMQLPWADYAKRTPRELEAIVADLDQKIRAARNVGGKIEAGSWNDVVSSMGPSLATNLPPLIAAALVSARNPAAGMAIANGGLGVMGLQKFGDNYLKGQMKGLSAADNLTQASLGAAAEVIPEKLSLNALFSVFKTMGKGAAIETIKAFAKQQLTEHSTEQITTIADHLIDKAYTEPNKPLESLWAEMKQTAMATAIQAPILAGGGMMAHGAGQIAETAAQRIAASRDITAGMEFNPAAIDAAARQSLDPSRSQIRQAGGLLAAPAVPRATPADVAAAETPEDVAATITDMGAGIAGPITESIQATQDELNAILSEPIESAALPQTPVSPVPAQPGAVAADLPGLLTQPVAGLDSYLTQNSEGRWQLARPIDDAGMRSAAIDELDRRNNQGTANAQDQAQQGVPALQDVPQAAPEAGALPDQLTEVDAARKQLEAAEPFSEDQLTAIDRLTAAVAKSATESIDSGEMPVFSVGRLSVSITPSAQNPGKFQATRYDDTGALGDSQYNSVEDAIRSEGLAEAQRLSSADAEGVMQRAVKAEAEFQSKQGEKNPPGSGPAPIVTQQSDNQKADAGPERGTIGMKLSPGQVVLTASGRETTPFPKFSTTTGSINKSHLRAVDAWLLQNARDEADSRGDEFNRGQFDATHYDVVNQKRQASQSDKDGAEEYLFGQQPDVPRSILKPLTPGKEPIGAGVLAQRQQIAAQKFIESAGEQFGLSPEDAGKAWDHMVKAKLIAVDALGGQYTMKDGRFWDGDVLRRAAGIEQEAKKPAEKSITRIKGGKLDIAGFSKEDVTESLKTAKIKATVIEGESGNVLVSITDRTGNPAPISIKQQNAIKKALMGAEAKPKKKRGYTGNLRNDVNLIAPGLYAEVARGGDGEGMAGFDMSLIAERLREEGFMLPETETGKDSDAVIEIIRQDIANGGGTLNEKRMVAAMDEAAQKAHRQDVLRLADEYGIETKRGIIPRRLEEIENDLAKAIEAEAAIAAKSLASVRDQAIQNGVPESEVDAISDHFADLYDADTAKDKFVLMYRDAVNAIQERIDGNQERQGRDGQDEGAGDDLPPPQGSEERPTLELAGQTAAEARAEIAQQEAAEAQRKAEDDRAAAAERQARIDAEVASRQDVAADNFTLDAQVNDQTEQRAADKKRIDDQLAGQGDIFGAAPAPSAQTVTAPPKGEASKTKEEPPPPKPETTTKTPANAGVSTPTLTIADVPPARMKKITVSVEAMVGDQVQTMEVPATQALSEIDEEIAAFKKLLDCVRAG